MSKLHRALSILLANNGNVQTVDLNREQKIREPAVFPERVNQEGFGFTRESWLKSWTLGPF